MMEPVEVSFCVPRLALILFAVALISFGIALAIVAAGDLMSL